MKGERRGRSSAIASAAPVPEIEKGGLRVAETTTERPRRFGLKLVLTALVLATVVLTALFIHLLWSQAARQNVADVVSKLNTEIVENIRNEVRGVRTDAI